MNKETIKKDYQTLQKETKKSHPQKSGGPTHLQQQHEKSDKTSGREWYLGVQHRSGKRQLSRIFEVLQAESVNDQDDVSISSLSGVKEAAKYISGCLQDVPLRRRDTDYIQSLLIDYRAFRPLPDGKQSISLHKVHMILQDNFPSSSLCNLMNLLLGCKENIETKVITF